MSACGPDKSESKDEAGTRNYKWGTGAPMPRPKFMKEKLGRCQK